MSIPIVHTSTALELRDAAEALLKAGTAPAVLDCAIGVDALNLLYQLSSDPKRAGDALKLLHELQVHQVELDLQSSHLASAEAELTADLDRYRDLFHCAPLGYIQLAADGTILEVNRAASDWLGIGCEELSGCRFEKFVAPGSLLAVRGLLKRLAKSGANADCVLLLQGADGKPHQIQAMAAYAPASGTVLLACCPAGIPIQM